MFVHLVEIPFEPEGSEAGECIWGWRRGGEEREGPFRFALAELLFQFAFVR